jgi:uncharacterized membrane protein YhaH (DUF805 family)
MDFASLYTSMDGRIGRQTFWIAILILIVINIVISFLILPIFGLSMMPNFAAMTSGDASNAQAMADAIIAASRTAAWASLVVFIIFAYPAAAVMIKRRHDKDNNGLDVWIYFGLSALLILVQALGIGMTTTDIGGISIPTPTMPLTILQLILGVFAIYLLVVLGFLKGTTGPNQYGPDPLGGTAAAAA